MKYFIVFLLFILWIAATIIMTILIMPIIMAAAEGNWFEIPNELMEKI